MKNPNEPLCPLCTNIMRLQNYLLAPDNVILFDWFIVKQISFKYEPFYYSTQRIEDETHIKRSRQKAIINSFYKVGFMDSYVNANKNGLGNVRYFIINFTSLVDKDCLTQIIDEKKDENYFREFRKYIEFHATEQQKATKDKKYSQPFDQKAADDIYAWINRLYLQEQNLLCPDEYNSQHKDNGLVLPRNKTLEHKLVKVFYHYNAHTLELAFKAYARDVLRNHYAPSNIMSYFLKYNAGEHSYPVIDKYVGKHIELYITDKEYIDTLNFNRECRAD